MRRAGRDEMETVVQQLNLACKQANADFEDMHNEVISSEKEKNQQMMVAQCRTDNGEIEVRAQPATGQLKEIVANGEKEKAMTGKLNLENHNRATVRYDKSQNRVIAKDVDGDQLTIHNKDGKQDKYGG